MPQYGSSQNLISQNLSQTVDSQGNPIISSDTGFGASPLGYAARVQALFGLPNATFELTPPDTTAVISQANQLPYWDIQDYSSGVMSGSAVYDSTTNSWGVNLNPGTAASGDYITMTTRSYLVNDSNLSLRQQALSVVSKVGTYAGTTQWNLNLVATYYDQTDTLLHSGTVATILDNATWTSMAGTTTTGGTAISASAHYVDLTYTLTATAAVTSSTSVTIKSCLLQTSTGTGGGAQSFVVTETFTSSGTFTKPTGVNSLLAVIAYGGGGGGGGGQLSWAPFSTGYGAGSGGGGGSRLAILRDLALGTAVATVSIGIGAGGAGGTAQTLTKTAAGTAWLFANGADGATGGATTFGSYLSVPGGGGGKGGSATSTSTGGTSAGAATTTVLGISEYAGGTGAQGGARGTSLSGTESGQNALTAGTSTVRVFSTLSYLASPGSNGSSGGSVVVTTLTTPATSGTSLPSASSGTAINNFLIEGGGASPGANSRSGLMGTASIGGYGAGGAGGGFAVNISARPGTVTVTTGNGGAAGANTGSGGGGAGGANINTNQSTLVMDDSRGTVISGSGGAGGSGLVTVVYIG